MPIVSSSLSVVHAFTNKIFNVRKNDSMPYSCVNHVCVMSVHHNDRQLSISYVSEHLLLAFFARARNTQFEDQGTVYDEKENYAES